MTYNPQYNKQTWSSEELITSTKLNQMVDNSDHNYKYKPELGPDAPTSNPIKIARGTKRITLLASDTGRVDTVTFSTEAADGNPSFINAPKIICNMADCQSELQAVLIHTVMAVDKTNTTFRIMVNRSTTSGADYWFDIDWIAIGN